MLIFICGGLSFAKTSHYYWTGCDYETSEKKRRESESLSKLLEAKVAFSFARDIQARPSRRRSRCVCVCVFLLIFQFFAFDL
jgi:hypothetical protein